MDEHTYHFCLTASKETIHQRLLERGGQAGNWCFLQTDQCLKAYEENDFGVYIDTEHVPIPTMVETIINTAAPFSRYLSFTESKRPGKNQLTESFFYNDIAFQSEIRHFPFDIE